MPEGLKGRRRAVSLGRHAGACEKSLRWVRWFVPLLVVLTTIGAFFPVLQNGFLSWDDNVNLVENIRYRGLSWTQLQWMFTTFHKGHYQPLSWVTFGLDYSLWGLNPTGYHLTSLALHTANAALFYIIAVRLLGTRLSADSQAGTFAIRVAAGFAALVFAVHPLRVESVAWATERRDVLSGLFFLLTILSYLRLATLPEDDSLRTRWLLLTLMLYGFSLLSKASGITLPLVLLILDIYPLGRFEKKEKKWIDRHIRNVLLEKLPFVFLAGIFGMIALFAQREAGALKPLESYDIASRLAQVFFGTIFYLWKTLVPLSLSPLYPLPLRIDLFSGTFLLAGLGAFLITAVFLAGRRRWPAGLATWAYYVAVVLPVLGIAQSGPQLVADRYSYLSCLGWPILAGAGLFYYWEGWLNRRVAVGPAILAAGLSVVVIVGLVSLTWKQTQIWHDSERFWRYTVKIVPESAIAHYNLGNILERQGSLDQAAMHYLEALRIAPSYPKVYNNLGIILESRGELDEAVEHYQRALNLDPTMAEAHYNLGSVLARRGELESGIFHFREALRWQTDFADAHESLARALDLQGRRAEAVEHMEKALKILRARGKEGN